MSPYPYHRLSIAPPTLLTSVRTSLTGALPSFRLCDRAAPSCLIIFFSALAGVGYVDPEAAHLPAAEFIPGLPVYDARADQAELARMRMAEEQKELERAWQKKKRPQDVSLSLLYRFLDDSRSPNGAS